MTVISWIAWLTEFMEISHGKSIFLCRPDYSQFLELKAQREEMELASDRKRRSVLRMELEWAARGCRARSTKQQSTTGASGSAEGGKGSGTKDASVELDSVETRMGKKTIELHHIK